MAEVLTFWFLALFVACVFGIAVPYRNLRRGHFALGAIGAFALTCVVVPKPTPEERAARKMKEEREAAEEAKAEAMQAAADAAAEVRRVHDKVAERAAGALADTGGYTKGDYRSTYARVGAATFARLNELEPGAVYVAAESRHCDRVGSAMVSDMSKPGKAIWFVDCANGNRFMVAQAEAAAALARAKKGKLVTSGLEESCTIDTVALCKASPAQRAAKEREIEFITACSELVEQVLVSPSSASMKMWKTEFGKGDVVTYLRPFDSQNAFGATLRAHFVCDVDAAKGTIRRLEVRGPMGTQRVL